MAALEGADPPIVHRDLKPSNVFIDGANCARVADMNLSVRLHEESLATLTGETGTYLYMSPEMMRHEVCSCALSCEKSSSRSSDLCLSTSFCVGGFLANDSMTACLTCSGGQRHSVDLC
jgi:serine/threonine protein kinase